MGEQQPKKRQQLDPGISAIEAHIAFFDARRALLEHEPDTAYKRAQIRVCEQMQKKLNDDLSRLLEKQVKPKAGT